MKIKAQVQTIEISKNTSTNNRDRVLVKKESNRKHKRFVSRFEHQTLRHHLHSVKDFHYPQRNFHKETTRSTQDPEYTTPTFNPLHKR